MEEHKPNLDGNVAQNYETDGARSALSEGEHLFPGGKVLPKVEPYSPEAFEQFETSIGEIEKLLHEERVGSLPPPPPARKLAFVPKPGSLENDWDRLNSGVEQEKEEKGPQEQLSRERLINGLMDKVVVLLTSSTTDKAKFTRDRIESLREMVIELSRDNKTYKMPPWLNEAKRERTGEEEDEDEEPVQYPGLVIDSRGNFWKWNCGWEMVDVKHNRVRSKRPLGHLEFNKSIKKATRTDLNKRFVRLGTRPNGDWRRVVTEHVIGTPTLYVHPIYKHVEVVATDGVHAIVKNYYDKDQPHKEVMFNSLSEIRQGETKISMAHSEKKQRKTKTKSKEDNVSSITVALKLSDLSDLLK